MAEQKGVYGPIALTPRGDDGVLVGVANPEEADVIITRVTVDVTTESDGAANLQVGVAANATTADNSLITATAVGAAATIVDSVDVTQNVQKWEDDEFLTFHGSADTTGLVANAYIEYIRV